MKYVFFLFWLCVLALGISFSILNARHVSLDYGVGQVTLPLPLLLVLTLLVGALLGILTMVPWLLKSKRANRQLKRRQSLPLEDD